MKAVYDHERALLLVCREGDAPSAAFEALLEHPDVAAWVMPAPWAFELAGVDLLSAMPGLGTITRDRLPEVLEVLVRLHTRERLEAHCQAIWRATSEQVRAYFQQRSFGATLAGIFRVGPKTIDLPPPPNFVQEQIYTQRFELQYRLHSSGERTELAELAAPPEEGSLVLYPFDVANEGARAEAGLGEGTGPVLEAFAYTSGRERHRRVLEEIAHGRGWQVHESPS